MFDITNPLSRYANFELVYIALPWYLRPLCSSRTGCRTGVGQVQDASFGPFTPLHCCHCVLWFSLNLACLRQLFDISLRYLTTRPSDGQSWLVASTMIVRFPCFLFWLVYSLVFLLSSVVFCILSQSSCSLLWVAACPPRCFLLFHWRMCSQLCLGRLSDTS